MFYLIYFSIFLITMAAFAWWSSRFFYARGFQDAVYDIQHQFFQMNQKGMTGYKEHPLDDGTTPTLTH